MTERILQAPDEALGCLSPNRFAVALTRMTQHHAEQVRSPAFFILDHPSALSEIHLQFLPWLNLHATKRQLHDRFQPPHKTLHRIIAARKFSLGHQVLVNALSR